MQGVHKLENFAAICRKIFQARRTPSPARGACQAPLAIIGVIGGVGPQAGLDFVQKIFAKTKAKKDQDHLNCMLISCPSIIPDRTEFLLQGAKEEENPAYGLFESACRLYSAGVRIAAVACNTAHAGRIFSPFCSMVKESLPGMKIVNMLETCAAYAKESHINRLGLLASIGTHKSAVYHEYFRKQDGFTIIEPDSTGQNNIHEAIYSEDFGIKAQVQKVSPAAIGRINHEIFALAEKGADAIILGCTELPLAMRNLESPVPLIDPGLIAARRLIALTAPEKLLP
jgi:aspartate racemase